LIITYQGCYPEEVLKYGDRDISESSWVSSCSKGDLAQGRTTTFIHPPTENFAFWRYANTNKTKEKCSSVVGERWLHSNEMFIAVVGSQDPHDSCERSLIPQGLIGEASSKSNK
jgi:hypothetical protein